MLEVNQLNKFFGKHQVLNDINLSFGETGISIIVGANGSGKTTLLNCISGLADITSGAVLINNYPLADQAYKENIFYVPSDFYLPNFMTGIEYGRFTIRRFPKSNFDEFCALLDVLDLTGQKDTAIESYSFGMKKKVQLAAAISANTPYILADEAFSGLDFETVIFIQEIFKIISKKRSIILVSHEENIINYFPENILLMREGTLTAFKGDVNKLIETVKEGEMFNEKISEIKGILAN